MDVFVFDVSVAWPDEDRYYQSSVRLAQHSDDGSADLVLKVLAYGLEYKGEQTFFTRQDFNPKEPELVVLDELGGMVSWVEIGQTSVARLTRASKRAGHVSLYSSESLSQLEEMLQSGRIANKDRLRIFHIDPDFIQAIAQLLSRRNEFGITRLGSTLYVVLDGKSFETEVSQRCIGFNGRLEYCESQREEASYTRSDSRRI